MKDLKHTLHSALLSIGKIESCAFLNYPNHLNIGDHLIWLGSVFYITDVLKARITYASDMAGFSEKVMDEKVGQAPIFIQGGGSLGDIWPKCQAFHEKIVSQYPKNQIIILPQTIYFKSQNNLERAQKIFNSHPNLTIFVRDSYSYEIAVNHFNQCKVIKSPDMAFQLLGMRELFCDHPPNSKQDILYLDRLDKEKNTKSNAQSLGLTNVVVEDWVSFHEKWKFNKVDSALRQNLSMIYREIWQRGLLTPQEWLHRQKWQKQQILTHNLEDLADPFIYKLSLSMMHSGIYQLTKYRMIVTNRLHGHILSILLEIPHIFLDNSYHKNLGFYESWTHEIPFCRFASDTSESKNAIRELNEIYNKS